MNQSTKKEIALRIGIYATLLTIIVIWSPWGKQGANIKTTHLYFLLLATIIWILGYSLLGGRFIRPKWKQFGKLIAYLIISLLLLIQFDEYALIFIIGHQSVGWIFHYALCKRNDINIWTCQPQDKYIELMSKWEYKR